MGELTALPDLLAGFKGHTSNGGDRKGKKGRGDNPKSWFTPLHAQNPE